jgi:succinate dehydrogenase/fumarate reductase flavoprotein subunit
MTGVLELPVASAPAADPVVLPKENVTDPDAVRGSLQRVMSSDCGVVRDADGLDLASETLADLARLAADLPARRIASYEVIDLLRVSRAIVASAAERAESRGAHTRREYPEPSDKLLGRFVSRGGAEPVFVRLPGVVAGGRP